MAITVKERKLMVAAENIPDELKELKQWCCFKLQRHKEKMSKIPMNPYDGGPGRSNDEATWSDFDTAIEAIEKFKFDGLGFYFKEPYFGIDIDDVKEEIERFNNDEHDDNIVSEFIDMMCSYSEISVSGTGIHIIVRGELPEGARRRGNIEMYDSGRFFAMTGNKIGSYVNVEEDEFNKINYLHQKYLHKSKVPESQNEINKSKGTIFTEDELINIILKSKTGGRFQIFLNGGWEQFYNSQSEADMAFCNDLAFWTNRDYAMMDSIFRKSSLNRDKWDRPQNTSTYGDETLQKAINECRNTFSPESEEKKHPNWWRSNGNRTLSFLHHILAKEVLEKYSIVRYPSPHSDLYYYNPKKGIYEQDRSGRQINGIIRSFDDDLKNSQIREVYHYILEMSPVINNVNENYIALENGLLNLKSFQLEGFNSKIFVLQKVAVKYNSDAFDNFIESTLQKVTKGHEPSIKNIEEMFGCVLYPGLLVPRMFYLYGRSAHNGKSSILNMIHYTFNKDGGNISAVSPQKLATNTFAGASLYGKLANVVDDQPDQVIEDSGTLKTIITGGYIEIEKKGKDSETVKMSTVMITASNFFPNFKESGAQINRRLHIIPFEHNFSLDEECLPDGESLERISSDSAREYVLKLAVDSLKGMLANSNSEKLTTNDKSLETAKAFAEHNDPMIDYFFEYDEDYFNDMSGTRVLSDYEDWCRDNRVPILETKRFKETVCGRYDLEWKLKRVNINGFSKPVKGFKSKK